MAEVEIKGLSELKKQLERLPANIEKNVTRGALRAGAKVMQTRAKELCPVKSGALRNSIKIKSRVKRSGWIDVYVAAGDKTAYYAHMIEGGTIAHMIAPKKAKSLFLSGIMRELVNHPGSRPKAFMRPAWDEKQHEALEEIRAYFEKRIPKELKKAGI